MTKPSIVLSTAAATAAALAILVVALPGTAVAERPLADFGEQFDASKVEIRDAEITHEGTALRIATGTKQDWPGVVLAADGDGRDLSAFEYVAMDVKNVGDKPVEVHLKLQRLGDHRGNAALNGIISVPPGEKATLTIPVNKRMAEHLNERLFGMRGYPGRWFERRGIDPTGIGRISIFLAKPAAAHVFEVANLRAGGEESDWRSWDDEELFPLVDRYGQYVHRDWPDKTHSDDDLARRKQEEAADLAAHPGPEGWNHYGGWADGPKLEATGRFRVEKRDGRWWLVDPEGRLFWSHGIDCVRSTTGYTPITDREHYFAELPEEGTPAAAFYGRGDWAPHGYYQGRGPYRTFNFTGANLLRKHGDDWRIEFNELCHRRLRSWGLNTIANWSDPAIYALRKTTYVVTVSAHSRQIEGSEGYWGKFPDPFDPSLERALEATLKTHRDAAGDPWCLGYFVGNELSWGSEASLAEAALRSPANQPAKQAFAEWLKAKYETVARLNDAWGTGHASWDALLKSTTPPDAGKAKDDLAAFYSRIAEEYFRVCRAAVKAADPEGLYLGCRFAWVNDRAVRAAAEYCDVVSFNRYSYSVADFRLPEGVDKPVVIGEFHFGALDRGMLHTGLRPVANQEARAAAYRDYVRGALENPWIVGTHWFQYGDQATTGRGDGENYQIGFLDVCDTPYPETIRACREVGAGMYRTRSGSSEDGR